MALTQLLLDSNVKCQEGRSGQKLMLNAAYGEGGGSRRNTSLSQRPINYGFHRIGNCSTEGSETNFRGGVIVGPAKDVMKRRSKQRHRHRRRHRHADDQKVHDRLRRCLSFAWSFSYFVRKVKSAFYNNGFPGDAVSDSRVRRINEVKILDQEKLPDKCSGM